MSWNVKCHEMSNVMKCQMSWKGVLERERLQRRVAEETWQEVEGGDAQVRNWGFSLKMFQKKTVLIFEIFRFTCHIWTYIYIEHCIFRRVEVRVEGLGDQFEVQDGCIVIHHPRHDTYQPWNLHWFINRSTFVADYLVNEAAERRHKFEFEKPQFQVSFYSKASWISGYYQMPATKSFWGI